MLAKGEKVKEAEDAGADFVGSDEFIAKIQEGWLEFDTIVATPDMMKDVGRLGKILGPRGLMPNPKSGTVTFDLAKAVTEARAGKIEYRTDKTGNVHAVFGKGSFTGGAAQGQPPRARARDRAREACRREGPVHQERNHFHHDGTGDQPRRHGPRGAR